MNTKPYANSRATHIAKPNTSQFPKWLVDVALFALFIATFFLDLTGLDLHQWIGIAAGALTAYHLITHWSWVSAVTRRFAGQTSNRSRLYYVTDAALALGLAGIIATGVAMSTWFNLPLDDYESWRVVHVAASIGTLVVTVIKIALHWRWIVTVAKNARLAARPAAPRRAQKPALAMATVRPAGPARLSRRSFLGVMGTVGVASAFALSNAWRSLEPVQAEETTQAAQAATTEPATTTVIASTQLQAATLPATSTASTAAQAQPAATATTAATVTIIPATAIPTATAVPTQAAQVATTTCTVLCNKGCAYPGRCRKYVDSNGNGLCDRGECL
jgi:hypothetical protein